MIRLAVCDDEEDARIWLRALVERQGVECEIAEYADGASYLASGIEYDLLLLDIGLKCPAGGCNVRGAAGVPEGKNASGAEGMSGAGDAADAEGASDAKDASNAEGLNLARRIRGMELEKQPIIIFITGYEKYVYEAFDVDAFHYLVKPVDERKFAEVFGRAATRIWSGEQQRRKTLVIQYGGVNKAIPLDGIYYMESQNHKVVLHTKDGELEYYGKLGELEKELEGQFARIHKGYLVNLFHVEKYGRAEVTLTNGRKLMISKYKFGDFVKAYLRWMR